MHERYRDFDDLSRHAREGRDFTIEVLERGTDVAVVAPHGGGIEPGTSEIARAIADGRYSLYDFRGVRPRRNGALHLTSTRFDEPRCLRLLETCDRVLAIHGELTEAEVVWVGGLDAESRNHIRRALVEAGFDVRTHPDPGLQGEHPANLCNRGRSGTGVQLELSLGLRRSFFASLDRAGREHPGPRLSAFVAAVQLGLGA